MTRPCFPPFRADDLSNGEIDVVSIELDAYGDASTLAAVLDADERARADRFVFPVHRRRFIVAHAMLRLVLARVHGTRPGDVRFTVGAHGKPGVEGATVEFNLSHSGERALVALARDAQVGIDVEEVHAIDTLDIASRFFSTSEHAALASTPAAERTAAFFRCWTRKESFVKARGDGLSCPLDGFDVTPEAKVANALLACRLDGISPDTWSIMPLEMEPGYVAAATVGRPMGRVRRWSAPEAPG